jgi:hypothetical protein
LFIISSVIVGQLLVKTSQRLHTHQKTFKHEKSSQNLFLHKNMWHAKKSTIETSKLQSCGTQKTFSSANIRDETWSGYVRTRESNFSIQCLKWFGKQDIMDIQERRATIVFTLNNTHEWLASFHEIISSRNCNTQARKPLLINF